MSLDAPASTAGFALLSSGANFSCEVMRALVRRCCPPALLVLPEYPPVTSGDRNAHGLIVEAEERRLLVLGQDIEIAYAPAARQVEFARQVETRAIDFLLVACWPYLIGPRLISSAARATLNLHPSLLPKYRGPDPLEQQLAAGDSDFGVSLHLLNQSYDQGDIIAQAGLTGAGDQPQREILEQRCAEQGVELFIEAIRHWPNWNRVAQTR